MKALCFCSILYLLIAVATAVRCPYDGSDNNFFQCANDDCISLTRVCDGSSECRDNSDESLCQRDLLQDNYLLVADQQGRTIYQISLPSGSHQVESGKIVRLVANQYTNGVPYTLQFDSEHRIVYWTDRENGRIMKLAISGRRRVMDPVKSVAVYQVPRSAHNASTGVLLSGLAVDVVGRKLYYGDEGSEPKIGEVSIGSDAISGRVLYSANTMRPQSLAFYQDPDTTDPASNRYIYWTDIGVSPSVNAISLQPRSLKHIIASRDIVKPHALAIDVTEQSLYWVDTASGRIERCNLDGSNRKLVYSNAADQYFGIGLSNRYIYVTNREKRSVQRLNRRTLVMNDVLPMISHHLTDVVHYDSAERLLLAHNEAAINSLFRPSTTEKFQRLADESNADSDAHRSQTHGFYGAALIFSIIGVVLAVVILSVGAIFVFIRVTRGTKIRRPTFMYRSLSERPNNNYQVSYFQPELNRPAAGASLRQDVPGDTGYATSASNVDADGYMVSSVKQSDNQSENLYDSIPDIDESNAHVYAVI